MDKLDDLLPRGDIREVAKLLGPHPLVAARIDPNRLKETKSAVVGMEAAYLQLAGEWIAEARLAKSTAKALGLNALRGPGIGPTGSRGGDVSQVY